MELCLFRLVSFHIRMYEDECITCCFSIYLTRCLFVFLTKDSGFFLWVRRGWVIGCPLITFHVKLISHPLFTMTFTLRDKKGDLFVEKHKVVNEQRFSKKVFFHNLNLFLACMIFLTIRSVIVFSPGNLLMDSIILVSAFHLSSWP